jgi:large subunit ribosomal protein L23
MKSLDSIIIRSIETEKAAAVTESGSTYTFEVGTNAGKPEIKAAIEGMFGVHVEDVRTAVVRGKWKRFGRFVGKRPNWKKAFVRVRQGESINLFSGV